MCSFLCTFPNHLSGCGCGSGSGGGIFTYVVNVMIHVFGLQYPTNTFHVCTIPRIERRLSPMFSHTSQQYRNLFMNPVSSTILLYYRLILVVLTYASESL